MKMNSMKGRLKGNKDDKKARASKIDLFKSTSVAEAPRTTLLENTVVGLWVSRVFKSKTTTIYFQVSLQQLTN